MKTSKFAIKYFKLNCLKWVRLGLFFENHCSRKQNHKKSDLTRKEKRIKNVVYELDNKKPEKQQKSPCIQLNDEKLVGQKVLPKIRTLINAIYRVVKFRWVTIEGCI